MIDDEKPILSTLKRILPEHEVDTISRSADALNQYEQGDYDLVICDVMMPDMSGQEIYEALAALGEEHARRVIFITGGAFGKAEKKFLEGVPNPCVKKPFRRAHLREVIADVSSRIHRDI